MVPDAWPAASDESNTARRSAIGLGSVLDPLFA